MENCLLTTIEGTTIETKLPFINYELGLFFDIDEPVHIIMEKDQIIIKFLNIE